MKNQRCSHLPGMWTGFLTGKFLLISIYAWLLLWRVKMEVHLECTALKRLLLWFRQQSLWVLVPSGWSVHLYLGHLLLLRHQCLGSWCVSSGVHINASIQGIPAEHCNVTTCYSIHLFVLPCSVVADMLSWIPWAYGWDPQTCRGFRTYYIKHCLFSFFSAPSINTTKILVNI